MPTAAVSEHNRGKPFLIGKIEIKFLLITAIGIRNIHLDGGRRSRLAIRLLSDANQSPASANAQRG